MHKEAREKAEAELNKLRMMSPMSAEATVVRNYVDWLVGVPMENHAVKFLRISLKQRPFSKKTIMGLEKG